MPWIQAIAGVIVAGVEIGIGVAQGEQDEDTLYAAERKQKKNAALARKDYLQQNATSNRLNQDSLLLNRQELSFQKRKWREQFMFTRQQYADEKKAAETNLKRQDIQQALTNMMGYQQASEGQKNTAVSRLGV